MACKKAMESCSMEHCRPWLRWGGKMKDLKTSHYYREGNLMFLTSRAQRMSTKESSIMNQPRPQSLLRDLGDEVVDCSQPLYLALSKENASEASAKHAGVGWGPSQVFLLRWRPVLLRSHPCAQRSNENTRK